MSDRDDYTWVSPYSVDGYIRRKPSKGSDTFTRPCAFCEGSGIHPGTVMNDDCPACDGQGDFQFEGDLDDYRTCRRCGGTGRQTGIVAIRPCHICGGAGIIR